MWLAPEIQTPLIQLQEKLAAIFPDCEDITHYTQGYVPHLSIGSPPTDKEPAAVLRAENQQLEPIHFKVDEISWVLREKDGPFYIKEKFPLAS